MKVDNSLTLPVQKLTAQSQDQMAVNHGESQVSKAVKSMATENPIVMDALEIKSILYLGIKGAVKLESSEGQSIDTFA